MTYFDIQTANIRRAVRTDRIFGPTAQHRTVAVFFATVSIFGLLSLFAAERTLQDKFFGWFLLSTLVTFLLWVFSLFYSNEWSVPAFPSEDEENLANFLDLQAAECIALYLGGKYASITALLIPILKIPQQDFVWYRIGVAPQTLQQNLQDYLKIPADLAPGKNDAVSILIQDALAEVRKKPQIRLVSWRDLLIALAVHSDFLRRFLFELKLEKKDIAEILAWQEDIEFRQKRRRKFWLRENLMRTRGIGKDWAAGFTVSLDRYASDITEEIAKHGFAQHLFGRQAETEAIERILARAGENNVVIVGGEGVGRKTIIYALAKRILHGETLPPLQHKRVLRLDISLVLAGAASPGDIEERLKIILNEAIRAENVILLIEEIHTLFDSRPGVGQVNATELLLPYLDSSRLQVIGLTTPEGYHATIARSTGLLRTFQKVEIKEPAPSLVMEMLKEVVPQIETHNQVLILYQSMRSAVQLADRYIKTVPFPEKAIDLLQEAAVYAQTKGRSSVVRPEHVEEVVHIKTDIPVGKVALAEKEILLELERILHRKIIGQDEAIIAVANALRRSRSGITSEKKPIGSFLFLGPTGVGKTETAKALAEVYFGSQKRMIRFDMSEYQQPDSVERLIGQGEIRGQLTTQVMEAPFSLLLFDEVEKAHPKILDLFLQVLDEGRLTDDLGRVIDFTNTILIFTSNAGAELIRESVVQFRETNLKERLLDSLQKTGIFKPEFLNRFDAVIIYKPLSEEQTEKVAELFIQDLNRRLKAKDIQIAASPELLKKIVQIGYDREFGARPLRRVIQDRVETVVAKKLLSGETKRGDTITISPEEI
ncbi:MAG TPA: ATP-dependent Clp protease ATP-binding subunit [Patescibacteria group bacterium]|nr:ATP-dependent Clp protease ATP-binding subunit [Patescibacteria group bacterium]